MLILFRKLLSSIPGLQQALPEHIHRTALGQKATTSEGGARSPAQPSLLAGPARSKELKSPPQHDKALISLPVALWPTAPRRPLALMRG